MRFVPWFIANRPKAARKPVPFRNTTLGMLVLEERITPDARDIGGLRFNAPGTFVGSSSNASISTAVEVGLVPASGQPFVPLLSLPNGVAVTSSPASAKINSTLSARGLTFTGNNLGFVFDQPNNKFSIAGDASFTAGGVTIGASFGSAIGTPGLVIQSGKLQSVDLGITTSFSYGSVSFNSQDLRLKLDTGTATSTRYAVSGAATATVAGQSSPILLSTRFGESPAKPGLVVVNGQLTDLTVGVNSSFDVAGVKLQSKDLTFAFNQAAKSYALFGSAGVAFKNSAVDVGFEALLGNSASPGVSVVNGKLVSLNIGVNSNFDVAGVSINTKALTFALNVPSNTYTLSGSAGMAFEGTGAKVDLDVAFGSGGTPGLRVVNGQLQSLGVTVNGGFRAAGLEFRANGLSFNYNRQSNTYALAGSLKASTAPVVGGKRVLDNITIQLGGDGLVVKNGRLESINLAVSGAINLGPLQVASDTTNPLKVEYRRSTNILQFTGKLSAKLGTNFSGSVALTNGGLVINLTTGAVQLNGFKVTIDRLTLGGAVGVRDAFVDYATNSDGSFRLSGGAAIDLPAGLTVGGTFLFDRGSIQEITLFLEKDPGVQLGSLPIFVQKVEGKLSNLSSARDLKLSGDITFTGGPSYRIGGKSVRLIDAKVGITMDLSGAFTGTYTFGGRMSLLGVIPLGSAEVKIDFRKSDLRPLRVTAFAQLDLFAGFVVGRVDLDLNATNGNLLVTASLALRLPDLVIPETPISGPISISGITLARVVVTLSLNAETPLSSFVQFEASLLGGIVFAKVKTTFRGDVTVEGTAVLVPFKFSKKIAPLFTDPADADFTPTVAIQSVTRVAGSPTNDLLVTFAATTGGRLQDAGVSFTLANRPLDGEVRLDNSAAYNQFTGIGTFRIVNPPEAQIPLNRPLDLFADFSDGRRAKFVRSAAFGPITRVVQPTPTASVRITSVERVAGSPTNDLRVNFRISNRRGDSTPDQQLISLGFRVNGVSRVGLVDATLGRMTPFGTLLPGQTFNRNTVAGGNTREGSTILVNPDQFAAPGQPFDLTGLISDAENTSIVSGRFGPVAAAATPVPALRILSANRLAGSPTGDIRVEFQLTRLDVPQTASLSFTSDASTEPVGSVQLTALTPNADRSYDPSTGLGFLLLRSPDRFAFPGRPITLTGRLLNSNIPAEVTSGPFGPVFSRMTIAGPATFTLPAGQAVRIAQAGAVAVDDQLSRGDATVRVRAEVRSTARRLTFRIAPEVLAGSGVTVEGNDTFALALVGPTAAVNQALGFVTVSRGSGTGAERIILLAFRDGSFADVAEASVGIPANASFGVTVPANAPATVQAFGGPINPYAGATIQLESGTVIRRLAVKLVPGTGMNGRPPFSGDVLNGIVPAESPIFPFFDPQSFELVFAADGTETLADYELALRALTYSTVNSSGSINLRLTMTDSRRQVFTEERTIRIINLGGLLAPLSALRAPQAVLFVDAGAVRNAFTGTTPVAVAAELTLTNTDVTDPLRTAAIALTGLFDATSDVLAFTSAGGITGAFDPSNGVLTLTAGAGTTDDDFRTALRSVTFTSLRKNPTAYPREVTISVTTAEGVVSAAEFGKTLVDMDVPIVSPGVSGTTTPLPFAPNAAPAVVFPDFDLVYPDQALPPPSATVGPFIPGTTITRGSVLIASNYIRGEDFLNFTPVGAITGVFFEDTGELRLDGLGTLAEYEQAIRSVTYQNRNTSPSTADREIVVVLDDGSASETSPTLTRAVQPQSDGQDTIRTSGSLNELVVTPFTREASLGLEDLNYSPRPGETELVYTILATPVLSRGTVRLTDGTIAEIGMEVPIEQLRGATFVASDTPRSGTLPFTFSISGRNPITRVLTSTPIVATVPIRTTNVAPTARDDAFNTQSETAVTLGFLGNDTDPNVDLLRVESFTQPANGTLERNEDGSYVYTPNAGFSGTDNFSYTIIDGAGEAATANGTITVAAPPVVPPAAKPLLVGFREFAVGSDAGGGLATLYNPNGTTRFAVAPFGAFAGGIRTASADFNGDGVADLVVGTGPGRSTQVVVIDGVTQAVLFTIDPFEAAFQGGVFVAVGDISGDGIPDLVITPDEGGGPRVRIFSGKDFQQLADFFGIDDPAFRGGARASVADITGDGVGDLIVSAGFGGGPRVAVFDGRSLGNGALTSKPFGDFFAFEPELRNGAFVTGGDLDGDGFAELIAGGGPGGGPRVTAFSGRDLLNNTQNVLANFFGGNVETRGGIRVTVKNLDGDNQADLIVGAGAGSGSRATAYAGKSILPNGTPPTVLDFDALPGFGGGVFVG